MKFDEFIRGLNKNVLFVALFAFVLIPVFDFYLFDTKEIFTGGYKIGKIIYSLLFSIVTAYIFYLLTAYTKEYKTKEAAKHGLKPLLEQIINDSERVIQTLSKASGIHIDENSSLENINLACKKIDPQSTPPPINEFNILRIQGNWYHFFMFHRQVIEKIVNQIQSRYFSIIDDKLIILLNQLDNSNFSNTIVFMFQNNFSNSNLEVINNDLKSYFNLISQIRKYSENM